ncbi:MAG: DNA polymerase II large subunit, partial [Methanomassiliicoccales archaeon]
MNSTAHRPAMSAEMEVYFSELIAGADLCYTIASEARTKGIDPVSKVEIPFASDMASRVEQLLSDYGLEGIAGRIRELAADHNREEVSLLAAKEIARGKGDRREVVEKAVRVGLAILTEGILVAPLEGISGVRIEKNGDGSEYVALSFSGPIRSAGGTGQAMSVLIADMVRRDLGIGRYMPTTEEIERFKEEIPLYRQKQHLQYLPSAEEIELVVSNCPVCIDGEGTEDEEVSGYRDLPRISTNRLRGGACIVIADGLCQKASKLMKHIDALSLDGWGFLAALSAGVKTEGEMAGPEPSEKYLKDIVAGRPVFCHPSRPGGFRLRYGRSRATGLAAVGLNPATMIVMDAFIAIGTQLKLERPGKAGAITPCTTIEGPIVLLKDGSVTQINDTETAEKLLPHIAEIIDNGEILISFGEFLENNHILIPAGYSLEWHREEMLRAAGRLPDNWEHPTWEEAVHWSEKYDVPLHPCFNLFWNDLSLSELYKLIDFVSRNGRFERETLVLPLSEEKGILEKLGALHECRDGKLFLKEYGRAIVRCLGLSVEEGTLKRVKQPGIYTSVLETVSGLSNLRIMPRAVTRIGARMARPEKAAERRMKPAPHVLFPLGNAGGAQRLFSEATKSGRVTVEMNRRLCPSCGQETFLSRCACGQHTYPIEGYGSFTVEPGTLLQTAAANLGENRFPEIKGVQGLISRRRTPEPLEKGILRAKHNITVFRDGTVRFDMTDVPLTHFRPAEIGLSVEKARQLGYTKDYLGRELTDPMQLCELKVQDVIPSKKFAEYMKRTADFIDDLLTRCYGLEPFYKLRDGNDLAGHLAMGLAPHTSGGILCRIIGFTDANVGYGHPFFHAAKRRNADGDEDTMMLLLDALLNFSREYLPASRGGLMDAPLVLSTLIDPGEIDKEAHSMDVSPSYPLEFHLAAQRFAHPKEVLKLMDTIGPRLDSPAQYEGFGFTHDTTSINLGPSVSTYTRLETMEQKLKAQLKLGKKIRAVDAGDVAYRVITRHFL